MRTTFLRRLVHWGVKSTTVRLKRESVSGQAEAVGDGKEGRVFLLGVSQALAEHRRVTAR